MNARERWKLYPQHVFIAADQLLNALIPPFWTLSYPDETLSARIYRAAKRGKIAGRIAMPIVDLLFIWQGPGHCKNAYQKEMQRKNLPPEYQTPDR